MKAKNSAAMVGAIVFLVGCAGPSGKTTMREEPREHATGMAALDDRRPIPVVTQHDPAHTLSPDSRVDKGLTVPPGVDTLVKAQDPKTVIPPATGAPAQSQSDTVTLEDSDLAARVKDAISKLNNTDANLDPALKSRETNGETKALQNIEVTAKNGLVTITGSTPSEAERTAIEQTASRVKGAISVSNYVTVSKTEKQ